ncbi:helicase-associated domain-containing protein [Kyrpidia spormannii]|uniref:Helicase XPB/Ssl2 N-terminal domain-containing protein n=1 Tax=Kyrpidia spormannii TaxID=2055160 RepID=A0A6F9E9P6_9BACL|nr:helicase-associated domain-containing protein [Kyrpidia spormannii]CAB3393022.1 conserved protein of unknown function [Kyrpidia spormannii]
MRLTECLNESDVRALQRIAAHYEEDFHSSSKMSLIQGIVAGMGRRTEICRRIEDFPPLMKDVVVALACEREVWSAEDLRALVGRVFGQGVEWREVADRVMERGWMFPLRSSRSQVLYHLPDEVRDGVRQWLREKSREGAEHVPEPLVWKDESLAIVRDTAVFLAYVGRREPELTGEGVLYRRHQQQIFQLMEIREEPLAPVTWRFGYGRRFYDYPDRFAMIYDFCYAKGYVEEGPERLALGARAREWLARSDGEKWKEMFSFWRHLYRRAIPELPMALIWLSEACAQGWVREDRLDALLVPYVQGYYYEDAETVKHRRIYAMLVHFGLLQCGTGEDGGRVYRRSEMAGGPWTVGDEPRVSEESRGIVVQPHFEILVEPRWVARLALDLGTFAEPVSGEGFPVYRLTRRSVRGAVDRGWSWADIVNWLRRHCRHEVPGNVETQILQWAKGPS